MTVVSSIPPPSRVTSSAELRRDPPLVGGWRRRLPHTSLMIAAALVALVSLLPLGFILWITLSIGWEQASALIFRPRVGELLINTALLQFCVLPLSIALAVALAWLNERTDLLGARAWGALAVAPLAVPAYVHSYAWVTLVPSLHGLGAATLISVLAYFPFLYLPVAAQLRRLDPAIEEAAASLGHGPWAVFFRAVLPQLRLAICGGALLVSLHLLAEYGLFAMIRFDTFATAILDQFQSAYSAPAANMLGGVLILSCGIVLLTEAAVRGQERYARIGSGAPRPLLRHRLGRYAWLCALIPLAIAMLSIGVPFLTLGRWLLIGGLTVWPPMEIGSALGQTFLYAATGAALTTFLAIPMAWLTVRAPGRCQRWLEACHYGTGSLPGVIIALALVAVTVHLPTIYQTAATLLLAYTLLFLPRALIGLRTSIAQAPVELEEAAAALGRGPLATLWRVTLPLAAPGVAASMALVGLGITTELTATLMLAPNGTRTLATEFWALTSEIDYVRAAPYAVMMVILSLPMTVLLHMQSRKAGAR